MKSNSSASKQPSMAVKDESPQLVGEIMKALKSIDSYGSIEIYVQQSKVTQITTRNIRKTRELTGVRN